MPSMIATRLQEAVGLEGDGAEALISAVIRVLAEQLSPRDRSTFIETLPPEVPRPGQSTGAPCDSAERFYERVGALAGLPIARATEASQVVCAALVDLLDAQSRAWLEARLPLALTTLLVSPEFPSRPPEVPHAQRRYATLADGRPGSAHPLSEAGVDRAHHDSIARSQNPHQDTKLSSASGPTQSREHETLADADPRPARPLSTGKQ